MIVNEIKKINNIKDIQKIIDSVLNIEIISNDAENFLNDKIFLKNFLYELLVEQKSEICVSKKSPINIKKLFRKQICKRKTLYNIYKKYPNLNRNLGSMPKIFLEQAANKENCSKNLFEILSKYSLRLNYSFSDDIIPVEELNIILQNFSEELSELVKYPINVSFVGNGANGNGFKISVLNSKEQKDFFYKVFYPRTIKSYDSGYRHGADLEPIYAYFISCNDRKNHFVKFYAGRFASQYEKDAFILTEYVEREPDFKQSYIQNIDFISSEDKRLGNILNGKIVDFGAIKIDIPALLNKQLRKIVRVVTSRINFYFDANTINYHWKIGKANCKILKKYIRNVDWDLYIQALNIISRQIPVLPKLFIQNLKNILDWDDEYYIDMTKKMSSKDIITNDIKLLKRNIKLFNLKIKSAMESSEDLFGYVILDLLNNRQAVYFLNNNNEITRLRIEKCVNNSFETLLELYGEDIKTYKNSDISALLCR